MTFTFDVEQPIKAHYGNTFTIEANSLEEAIAIVDNSEFDYNDYLDEESWDMIEDENDEDIRPDEEVLIELLEVEYREQGITFERVYTEMIIV